MENNQWPDIADFDIQRQQLARRRKLAEELLRTRNDTTARFAPNGGALFGGGPGQVLANGVDAIRGMFESQSLDREERDLAAREAKAANDVLSSIPRQGDPNRQAALLSAGNRMPSLRNSISALLAADERARENELNRIDRGEQEAANRVARAEEGEANRQNRLDARATPTVHITTGGGRSGGVKAPSGYRYNEDGTALEPIPGGPADKSNATKPLTQKQLETQRGFMDLDSSIANYEQLLNNYDFRGYDPRSGNAATNPAARAALEGAYTDLQMKLKTLYELGAPQAGDLKLLSQALPSPVDREGTIRGAAFGADPFKAKLNETRKLLNSSRANFETQLGKHTPDAAKPPPMPEQRVTVRSQAEWQALEPGTPYVTADGKKGVR